MARLFGGIAQALGLNPEDEEAVVPEQTPVEPAAWNTSRDAITGDYDPQYIASPGEILDPKADRLAKRQQLIDQLRTPPAPEEEGGFHPGKLMLNILQFSPKLGGFARSKLNEIEGRQGQKSAQYYKNLEEARALEDMGIRESDAEIRKAQESRAADKSFEELKAQISSQSVDSPEVLASRQIAKQYFPKLGDVIDKMNASQLKEQLPFLSQAFNSQNARLEAQARLADVDAQRAQTRELADLSRQQSKEAADLAREQHLKELPVDMRLKTAEDKKRFDYALQNLAAIKDMSSALDTGSNTFSLVGDNPYTAARSRGAEYFGRLQSGGAISKPEEKRFMQMLPALTDTKDIQQLKLNKAKQAAYSVLKTLGYSEEEANSLLSQETGQGTEKTSSNKGQIIEKTLKDGTKVKVKDNGDGTFTEVQ